MKQIYKQPMLDLITVADEDVIATSGKGLSNPNSFGDPKKYGWDSELT